LTPIRRSRVQRSRATRPSRMGRSRPHPDTGQVGTMLMRVHLIGPNFLSVYRIRLLAGAPFRIQALDIGTGPATPRGTSSSTAPRRTVFHTPDGALARPSTSSIREQAAPRQRLHHRGVTDDVNTVATTYRHRRSCETRSHLFLRCPEEHERCLCPRARERRGRGSLPIDRIWHGFRTLRGD